MRHAALRGAEIIQGKEGVEEAFRKNALWLRQQLVRCGGLMLKLGQFLSTRIDLFPYAYIEVLAKLQDRVPPIAPSLIEREIKKELGQPAERLYLSFSQKPLASASLAQVHKAKLYDSRKVAVKVLRPDVEKAIAQDLRIIRSLFQMVSKWDRHFNYSQLADEFERYLGLETDFQKEAEQMGKMREILKLSYLQIPEVVPERSCRKVLTTTYLPGFKITREESYAKFGVSKEEVAEKVLQAYFTMIFQVGFFQADPHPGNLFVLPRRDGFQIGIVDFGLCQELPPSFREGLVQFVFAYLQKDVHAMAQGLDAMGFQGQEGDPEGLRAFCQFALDHSYVFQLPKEKIAWDQLLAELVALAQKRPLVVLPPYFVLLVRCMGLLTGLLKQLRVKLEVSSLLLPFLQKAAV